MLKKTMTYEDFNGRSVTEDFYFNLNAVEVTEMEVGAEGGSFSEWIKGVVAAEDKATMVTEFKKLLLLTYGQKSEDGKSFVKSDELCAEFAQTAAFPAIFMELVTDEEAARAFVRGVLPAEVRDLETAASDTATLETEAHSKVMPPKLPPPAEL